MKSIELKVVKEPIPTAQGIQEIEIKTSELIRTACLNVPPGGFNGTDMLERLRILDKLDEVLGEKNKKDKTKLDLEDADYANLAKFVKDSKWVVVSRTISEFVKQF